MSNTTTVDAAARQTADDIHHLMNAIVTNLAVAGQPMSRTGLIRIESALHTVFSMRDTEAARLRTALEHAVKGLVQAELVVSDDYGRGSGSDLPSWECETATEHLVDAQQRADAALRGE